MVHGLESRKMSLGLPGSADIQLEGEQRVTVKGPEGGFFPHARNFVMNKPVFTEHIIQGGNDRVTQAMRLLVQHVIPGVEYDSIDRDPPPRCHPGTRVELLRRLTTWFYLKERQKGLLWVNGSAGVGKSAVIQTFAESIATSGRLGASVFFSQPNRRNDPHRVFVTIAYQLAVQIKSYRVFIAEQLALDPSLVEKAMKAQFKAFIFEPFVEKKIGAGEDTRGVLLDGLDEVEGQDLQCEIIRLISTFVLEHPEVPLVWVISSRPESHISDTFCEEETMPSFWPEYIPIGSAEVRDDIEHFLRAGFETIRHRFPHSIPRDWPSEEALQKIAGSGLFAFAYVAIRFVGDASSASPVSRLELVLSTIEDPKDDVTQLDALYTQILTSIRPELWQRVKRLLGFVLYSRGHNFLSHNLKGMSVILDLGQDIIRASLEKCSAILEIPPPSDAYSHSVIFLHASFANYLMDPTKSKDFHLSLDDAEDDVSQGLIRIMRDFVSQKSPRRPETFQAWIRYCSRYHSRALLPKSRKIQMTFTHGLFNDSCTALYWMVIRGFWGSGFGSQRERFDWITFLSGIDIADLYHNISFVDRLFEIWQEHREKLVERRLIREIRLRELKFHHLDRKRMCPKYWMKSVQARPHSCTKLHVFILGLEHLQQQMPELKVLIFGSKPEIRNALFRYEGPWRPTEYYFIPYAD